MELTSYYKLLCITKYTTCLAKKRSNSLSRLSPLTKRPLSIRLEILTRLWEPPHVKLRTDDRARLYGRDLLKPNTDYQAELEGNRIVLVEMVPAEPRFVRPRRVNGRLRPPNGFRPSRETIAAAIRADRDE